MVTKQSFQKLKTNFFEYLFPKFCVGCGAEGVWLCQDCEDKILPVVTQVCPDCGRISCLGKYCKKYGKNKKINGIICATYYEEGPTREIIHHFKYNSVTELADYLVPFMSITFSQNKIPIDIITFAPLHYRRLAERGYNQAEILAEGLGESCKLPVTKLLVKTKKTERQVVLKGAKRRKNLKGVFKLTKSLRAPLAGGEKQSIVLKGKNILIIDDISTTGATLNECAKVLKEAGAKKVWGLVVAKG